MRENEHQRIGHQPPTTGYRQTSPRFITGIGLLALPQPPAGGLPTEPLRDLRNVWLELNEGAVQRIGPEGEPRPSSADPDDCYDAAGMLATPGLIEAHTHPAFVHYRQREFLLRCQGKSYQDIAASGGGILSSVKGVREASKEELTKLVRRRFRRFLELGVTTVEAKSGYGLTVADELKCLAAIRHAAEELVDISPTLLGAHAVPPEHKDDPDRYVDIVCREMIPAAALGRLAETVDVFVEETVPPACRGDEGGVFSLFSLAQARRVFEAAREAGLGVRIHADQFSAGVGAELAAEFGAFSADHLDRTGDEGIRRLSDAGVTAVLLPGAVFFLGLDRYAPARRMIEAGCKVAISTDFNPGTSPTQSLPLMMTLACSRLKMTPAEALWAATMGGACALRREGVVGSLLTGYQADICLWEAPDVDYLPYAYGDSIPAAVFRKGTLVAEAGRSVIPLDR